MESRRIMRNKPLRYCTSHLKYSGLLVLLATLAVVLCQNISDESESRVSPNKLDQVFTTMRSASSRSLGYLGSLMGKPLGRILLAGGGVIGFILLAIRILVVAGPIFLLGSMARDSREVSDFLRLMVESYNLIVEALEDPVAPFNESGP